MKRLIFAAALLAATPTLAQTTPSGAPPIPPSQPSPIEQLLRERIGQEVLLGISCQANSASLQQQLTAAQARIKELEAKEPKK